MPTLQLRRSPVRSGCSLLIDVTVFSELQMGIPGEQQQLLRCLDQMSVGAPVGRVVSSQLGYLAEFGDSQSDNLPQG